MRTHRILRTTITTANSLLARAICFLCIPMNVENEQTKGAEDMGVSGMTSKKTSSGVPITPLPS